MPPITLSSISSSNVKVRWREPYASEGLNRKLAVVVPSGVYRGLKLGVSATNLSVDLVPDAAGDHVAVHENQLGFSTTYVDDTSGTITLPLSGFLANDVVVICLVVTYTSGSSTTALFRGYELSEYEALSSSAKQDLVVLGTVLRPVGNVIIPAANITHDRRKLPFLQRTDESTPWNPLIRNGGFELGQTNGTYRHASPFWTTTTTNANFTIRPVIAESRSGAKSLEMTTTTVGAVIATIQQDLWMPVTPGRFIMGRLYKKVVLAPSGAPTPTARMRFVFGDLDGTNDVNEDLLFDISAVDGSFEENGGIVKVPVTARVLKSVQIILNATYAGTGPCVRIDDVQAWAQVDGANWLDVQDSRVREAAVGDMFLGTANSFGGNSAKMSFDGTLLSIERRDGLQTLPPPALSINGRSFTNQRYTLLFQSAIPLPDPPYPPGLTVYYRKYVHSLTFSVVETVNASFDNGTLNWSKDVTFAMLGAAIEATKHEISYSGVKVYGRSGSVSDDAPWTEGGWKEYVTTAVPEITTTLNPKFAPILTARDASGNRRVIVDHNGFNAGRRSEFREDWSLSIPPNTLPDGWLFSTDGTGFADDLDWRISLRVDAAINSRYAAFTRNDEFVREPAGSQLTVAEWEWSPASVGTFLPYCKVAMGFFNGMAGDLVANVGLWIGARETDTHWQFASFPTGAAVNYWTEAGATGSIINTGVTVSGATTRMRIEMYGSNLPGGKRALAYINGNLVAEIPAASMPVFDLGWGMEIKRVAVGGFNLQAAVGEIVIRGNRNRVSDDSL